MDSILPERLLTNVRPAFDLVLRRIRSLKRCVQACGCKVVTPRYACNLAPGCISSEPTFAGLRKNKKKEKKGSQAFADQHLGELAEAAAHQRSRAGQHAVPLLLEAAQPARAGRRHQRAQRPAAKGAAVPAVRAGIAPRIQVLFSTLVYIFKCLPYNGCPASF